MTYSALTLRYGGYLTAAHMAGLAAIIAASVLAFIVYAESTNPKWAEDDASWTVFELGFEFQRLLLAAEKGESVAEIRLRGDIYLSRVVIVRDAPLLEDVRRRTAEKGLARLFESAQETERLIAGLKRVEQRDALLWHLRASAVMVRELMIDMAKLDRMLDRERRNSLNWQMLVYLSVLEGLMLTLFGLCALVFSTSRRLRGTGRELGAQLLARDAILRSVDSAIIGVGPDGEVLYSNPQACALLGPAAARHARLAECEGGASALAGEIGALLRHGPAAGHSKVEIRSESGTRHYDIRTSCSSAAHHSGDVQCREATRIVVVTDVTTEEEADHRRAEYDARLAEASRVLAYAALSGGIVHEISQPLGAVRNYAYALKVSLTLRQPAGQQLMIAERLGEEIDRAIEVVHNVRRMGPQDQGDDAGVCDVHEAIAHSMRLVVLGADPPPPLSVPARGGVVLVAGSLPMIGQVIVNLLKNALAASASAGRAGAEVFVTVEEGFAEIAIADHGEGVSEEAARTMFAPFSKSTQGGMGLGLAICQRIAQSLGGSLTWENRTSAGAIFRFRVPLVMEREDA